jgi:hypothetical protein
MGLHGLLQGYLYFFFTFTYISYHGLNGDANCLLLGYITPELLETAHEKCGLCMMMTQTNSVMPSEITFALPTMGDGHESRDHT